MPDSATSPPPVGEAAPAPVGATAIDPVAAAAQLAYVAFLPWRDALELRSATRQERADHLAAATEPVERARLDAAVETAEEALAIAAPPYRAARDALADAVIARAGRPKSDAVRLSAAWERTDPRRLAAVLAALMHVGDPYVFATAGPDRFDCSGLTRFAWGSAGIDLIHYAVAQRQQTLDVAPADLLPGDLAFRFRRPGGHVMLYLGIDDLVVQAGGTATGVIVSPWGTVDALGSPLVAPPAPLPVDATDLFGRGARARLIGDDVPLADAFNAAGARYLVAPDLLAAIAAISSGYRADGVMGLRPGVAASLGASGDDPFGAADAAAQRLVGLYLQLGDAGAALAAYPTALGDVRDPVGVTTDAAAVAFADAVEAAVASDRTALDPKPS